MSYILFLDDERNPKDVIYKNSVLEDLDNVVTCRSVYEARKYIMENGFPYHISFDYILNTREPDFQSGRTFANWLKIQQMTGNLPENITYYVHSEYEKAHEINIIMDRIQEKQKLNKRNIKCV